MMEEIAGPIIKASSKSEREMQIFLKENGLTKKKHWPEIWRRNSNEDWVQTEDPNNVLAKPNSKPKAKA